MRRGDDFFSPHTHGFVRVGVAVPRVRVADVAYNTGRTLELMREADEAAVSLLTFPELGLSAYSNDDLFQQDALLEAVLEGLADIVEASTTLSPVFLVGAPLRFEQKLFNCAVVVYGGRILGIVPKTYIPNYREFYEKRQFASAAAAAVPEVELLGARGIPFGADMVFAADGFEELTFAVEICEDLWAPVPPTTYAALAGATILANLSASNITIGKADYRDTLAAGHSGRCVAAYLYAAAGSGESTTDLAWDGHALVYENGRLLAQTERFGEAEQLIRADVDAEMLVQERSRLTSFIDAAGVHRERLSRLRRITFEFELPQPSASAAGGVSLAREVPRFPYVPVDAARRDERCFEAYNIQVHALAQRLRQSGIERAVLGISGGLDSTQALIVTAKTFDLLGLPRTNIHAYTMPGFATSTGTRESAHALMSALGVSAAEIDIRPSCMQMFRDIGHPFAEGREVYDVTFENVQAGERTSHLFRLANRLGALVVGTGDLSELALGWATYGVGDHMSHYNVNASVPKTLIQHLIRWVIDSGRFDASTSEVLRVILATEISPELVPAGDGRKHAPAQSTEQQIGPYELQDFNLYYVTRFGFRPSKVAYLGYVAWADAEVGSWPPGMAEGERHSYDLAQIKHWLGVFLTRFFRSQFKRSCVPNAPKMGSGGSLSPRGDWRAPSDGEAAVWLSELEKRVPDAGAPRRGPSGGGRGRGGGR
ncbi:MAG: NAD(+) synthase [Spirochaetaceae bacterium]